MSNTQDTVICYAIINNQYLYLSQGKRKDRTMKARQIITAIIVLITTSVYATDFAAGTGEFNDPYQIATAEQFVSIGTDPNLLDRHFVLVNDIDLDPNLPGGQIFFNSLICPYGPIPPRGHGHWIPWENEPTNPNQFFGDFNGVLDGAGHIIQNLVIRSECGKFPGLFGFIGEAGVIQDLGIESVTIDVNCPVSEPISGRNSFQTNTTVAGGLAAVNSGKIIRCFALGQISRAGQAGGLVGENHGIINNCYAVVDILNTNSAGGLVATNEGVVMFSYSTGAVEGINIAGGLVGESQDGYVLESYWDLDTSGQTYSAQGLGMNTPDLKDLLTYTTWEYTGTWKLDDQNDYPRLLWEDTDGIMIGQGQLGYGGGNGDVNVPYLIHTPEQFLTIAYHPEDFDKNFLLSADIDFNQVDCNYVLPIGLNHIPFSGEFDGDSHVLSNIVVSRPDQNNVGIFGVVGHPSEFPHHEDIHYRIGDNGIWSWGYSGGRGPSLQPKGTVKNLHLDNVMIMGQWYVGGLVGYHAGTILNCSVTGQITGQALVGGLVGRSINGTVDGCRADTVVLGEFSVGGLIGLTLHGRSNVTDCMTMGHVEGQLMSGGLIGLSNYDSVSRCMSTTSVSGRYRSGGCIGESRGSNIIQCCSNSSVTAEHDVGGFIGAARNHTRLTDCYSLGSVTGTKRVGGFAGKTYIEHIRRCYAASSVILIDESIPSTDCTDETQSTGGFVGSSAAHSSASCDGDCPMDMSGCFWDIDVSGLTNAVGNRTPAPDSIIGKTTAEMQSADTFLEAGWDFVDETENGTDDIWWILEGQDYPHLWWESISVILIEPHNGDTFDISSQPPLLLAQVHDPKGSVIRVRFDIDIEVAGGGGHGHTSVEAQNGPHGWFYEFDWSDRGAAHGSWLIPGEYKITAEATDDNGTVYVSPEVRITIL